mgnify:CR=1 FL=1
MKAFVSYPFGTDMTKVFRLLKEHNIEFFDGTANLLWGTTIHETIIRAITDCDLMFVVYPEPNANIAYEVGVAAALKKPIFSIIAIEGSQWPDFLMDTVHVFSAPEDYHKLKFTFEIFIKKIKPKRSKSRKKTQKQSKQFDPIDWLEYYHEISGKNERYLEDFVEQLLKHYQLEYSKRTNNQAGYVADFSFWSDPLENILGNPILIEVKKQITPRNIDALQKQIKRALEKTNAKGGIVFYNELTGSPKNIWEATTSNILFISILKLIEKLQSKDFEDAIASCRNEIIHKPL